MRAFNAILNGRVIDTVFYADEDRITRDEVYRSLVDHDGYDPGISVRERRDGKRAARIWRRFECPSGFGCVSSDECVHWDYTD